MNMHQSKSAALEKGLAEQLRRLLGRVSWLSDLKVEANPAQFDHVFDFIARCQVPGGSRIELCTECIAEPRPSQFPYLGTVARFSSDNPKVVRTRVFAAPHISPRLAELCEHNGWSWFDLAGNCRITVPPLLHIEQKGLPPVHQPPKPEANLGTPEAGRVVRVLLLPDNVGRRWTQRDMQTHCQPNVSLGLVNKVVSHLRNEAYIVESPEGGFRIQDPLKLLIAWRDAYRFDRHERRSYFTQLQGRKLRDGLYQLDSLVDHVVYASFSAADFQAPSVRQPKTWLYVSQEGLADVEHELGATLVDSGENLAVLVPNDEGVFYQADAGTSDELRLPCTNAVQTYVDLYHSGGRGQEAAEALLEQRLKREWKLRDMAV